MAAKYVYGSLIVYALLAGVVFAMHPSSNDIEIITDSLLWPLSFIDFLWGSSVNFYGRMFN